MRSLSRRFRILALLWGMMQVVIPPGMAIADGLATLSAGGLDAPAHVEAGPGVGCVPAHSADCAFCRFLSGFAARGAVHQPTPVVLAHATAIPRRVAVTPATVVDGHPLSRAPPIA
jgi:hypothetical protein